MRQGRVENSSDDVDIGIGAADPIAGDYDRSAGKGVYEMARHTA